FESGGPKRTRRKSKTGHDYRCRSCELLEKRRNELRHCRMDVHRVLQNRVRCFGVHRVQHAVDGFIAPGPEYGSTQNLLRLRVNDDFHQTVRLAFFDRASDASHRPFANQDLASATLRLGFGQTRTTEWWVDVERVRRNPVG